MIGTGQKELEMITITEIGITAGDIWHYLDKNGSAKLDQLAEELKKNREIVLMSLGWLARAHWTDPNPTIRLR